MLYADFDLKTLEKQTPVRPKTNRTSSGRATSRQENRYPPTPENSSQTPSQTRPPTASNIQRSSGPTHHRTNNTVGTPAIPAPSPSSRWPV